MALPERLLCELRRAREVLATVQTPSAEEVDTTIARVLEEAAEKRVEVPPGGMTQPS